MSDVLRFDVAVARAGFGLSMAEDIPLHGITAITGPSGSGKTTLLRILSGLEPGATGRVALGGRALQGQGAFVPPHKRGIGYVFQEPRLFPHLSVADNLAYGARRRGGGRLDDVAEVLNLGPLMGRGIAGLSGGEARRVALGRVLASAPAILFLDEPLTGLDAARKAEILPHIARASQAFDLPALYVSHARDEVLTLADRILTVRDGALTGWAPPPLRLTVRAVAQTDTGTMFALGEERIALDVRAVPGTAWSLTMTPETALLSLAALGASTARATVRGTIRAVTPGHLALEVAEQTLDWPTGPHGLTPVAGQAIWLTILTAFPRPEPG